MKIIPAIDLIDGKCVRLTQGDYNQKTEYNDNPLEVAKAFEGAGITNLHLVDLDGARLKKIQNAAVLEAVAGGTNLHIDFGGGIQSHEDVELAFNCGAKQLTGGSIAIKDEAMFTSWIEKFGSEKLILGADAKNEMIAISGWQETTDVTVYDIIEKYVAKGIKYVISTDVAKDGLLQGPSFDLYEKIQQKFPDLKLIASGGVTVMDDLLRLKDMGVYGTILGKAFYEGNISLKDLEKYNSNAY
jgi:phosphoribosylformimino-5-aminoimidazole carboxamide ribotide isomerase